MISWRDVLPIHPAAELFPIMGADELRALGEDIKKNGLRSPIITQDGVILDGRNRLDAMELVGMTVIENGAHRLSDDVPWEILADETDDYAEPVDPYGYVVSANIHRRHLTTAQKGELIEALLKARPERSDRATAKIAKVSDKTVGKVRERLEAGAEIPHHERRVGSDGVSQSAEKPKAAPAKSEPKQQPVTLSPAMVEQAPLAVRPNAPVVVTLVQRRLMALIALDDDLAKIEARYESAPEFQGILNLVHSARMIAKELQHRPPPPASIDNMNLRVIEGDQQQPDESDR